MRLLLGIISILLIAGCVTSKPMVGPDGTRHHLVSCDYIGDCYDKAREVCRGNYKIVNSTQNTVSASGSSGGTSTDILVKCGQ